MRMTDKTFNSVVSQLWTACVQRNVWITRDVIKARCPRLPLLVRSTFLSPQAVATKLDLPEDLVGYFSLFLIREGPDSSLTCESQKKAHSICRTKHIFALLLSCLHSAAFRQLIFSFLLFFFFPVAEIHQIAAVVALRRQKKLQRRTLADFEITFVQSAQPLRGDRRQGK